MTHYRVDLTSGEVEEMRTSEARTSDEERIHDVVADFAPVLDGGDGPAVDLTRNPEKGYRPDEDSGSYFGVDELLGVAAQEDAPISEDQELHDALRAQEIQDRFGEDDPNLSDEQLWDAFRESWGIEEEG